MSAELRNLSQKKLPKNTEQGNFFESMHLERAQDLNTIRLKERTNTETSTTCT